MTETMFEDVRRACDEAGLALRDVRLEGGLLQLFPRTLETLPSSDSLQHLAERLSNGEVRWVTLVLDEVEE